MRVADHLAILPRMWIDQGVLKVSLCPTAPLSIRADSSVCTWLRAALHTCWPSLFTAFLVQDFPLPIDPIALWATHCCPRARGPPFQDYSGDPLVQDDRYRLRLLTKLAQIGLAIETAYGGQPQDIEGVVGEDGETVHVVQTRPQVLSHNSYWY